MSKKQRIEELERRVADLEQQIAALQAHPVQPLMPPPYEQPKAYRAAHDPRVIIRFGPNSSSQYWYRVTSNEYQEGQ